MQNKEKISSKKKEKRSFQPEKTQTEIKWIEIDTNFFFFFIWSNNQNNRKKKLNSKRKKCQQQMN